MLLVLLLLAVFAVAIRLGHLASRIPTLNRLIEELAHTTTQIQIRGTFALLLGFIALSQWLGTEIILGAFLAGAVIAVLTGPSGSLLHQKMDAIGYGFFIPLFFIMVGVRFDLMALLDAPETWFLIPLLLICAVVIKLAAALFFRCAFTWRETWAAGFLLSARLSLIIAAAAIALELGAITEATHAAIICLAMMSCTLSPVVFNALIPFQTEPERHGVLLVGLGQLSTLLAERLRHSQEDVTLVGPNAGRASEDRKRGFTVMQSDPTPECLQQAGAEHAAALIALSAQDQDNLDVCCMARDAFGVPNLIALAHDPEMATEMSDQGIRVVQPQLAAVIALESAWHFPATFDILADAPGDVLVRETALANASLEGQPLRHIRLPGDVLILGLRRDGEALIPHGDTVLQRGDILMLVGHQDVLQQALTWINPRDHSSRLRGQYHPYSESREST